jgi:FkbM family methyltransferase
MAMKNLVKIIILPLKTFLNKKRNENILRVLSTLPMDNSGLTLIDIGAAFDIEPRWKRIEPFLNYVGFEPDERSRFHLNSKSNNCLNYQIIPYAVWDNIGMLDINFCRSPGTSSHFLPNHSFLDLFPDSRRFDILENLKINSTTLDNLNLTSADFIKLDIQGGELKALKGGVNLIQTTLGLEIEVEFTALYMKQPLFGEICSFLNSFEFEFIDFVNLSRWERTSHNSYGQCVFGDALFLRSPEYMIKMNLNKDSISKYIGICLLYNRFDLIDKTISLLPDNLAITYDAFLSQSAPLRRSNKVVRVLNYLTSSFFTLFGVEYRTYLLY